MAGEWRPSTWGEEISLEYGKALRGYDTASGKFRVFGSNGPIGWTVQPLAPGPGVILGRKGAYRGIEFSREPFFVIDTAYYVVPKTELDMRWLFYAIKYHKLGEIDDGSPIPSTTRSAVYVRDLDVPLIPEQKAIAHILGTLDDKIELNRRMNATLEAMARSLFQSWFVDFDPVRAKLDGRKPAGLDTATAALFPAHFQDSTLGHIPQGWRVVALHELSSYLSRGIGPAYIDAGGVCVLNQKCVRDHRVDFSKARQHDPMKKAIDGRTLQMFDILVNSTGVGTLGRVAQVMHLPGKAIVDSHLTVVRTANEVDACFLGVALTLRESDIEELGEGSTGQTELSRARLGGLLFVVPPTQLQKVFGSTVEPLLKRIAENDHQSRTLATLRDALLPKLLSGELSIN